MYMYIGFILKFCPVAYVANIIHINEWVGLNLEICLVRNVRPQHCAQGMSVKML